MADSFKNFVPGGFGLKPQSADPTNPKDGDKFQSDGTSRAAGFWEYKNGGWSLIGAGNSDLSIYSQFDAEDGSTTDFSNVAISASSPIAGDNSYTISTFPASFPAATLDERHANKTHSMECHYKLTSGTAKLLIKDNSANVLEELEVSSTDAEKAILTFYVSDSMTSVQLHIEDVSSATGLKIDDVIFSDDPFVYKDLINITDWEAYTPTTQGFGTIANVDVRSRRVGGSLEVFGRFNAGTPTASEARIYFPSGLTEKTGIVPTIVGHAFRNESLANTEKIITVISSGSNYITMGTPHKSSAQDPLGSRNGDNLVASGQVISFSFTVPIENWSASSTHVLTPATSTLSDWEDFTPTGSWISNVTYSGKKRRVGDSLECKVRLDISGGVDATGLFIDIPDSLSIDTLKVNSTTTAVENLGTVVYNDFGLAPAMGAVKYGDTAQRVLPQVERIAGNNDIVTMTNTLPHTWSSGDSIDIYFKVPIEGWDSNATFLAAVPVQQVAYVKDVKSNGINGGTFTSGAWRTRDLNTLEGDTGFISLSSNQFTLSSGKYLIEASAPAFYVRDHQCILYNTTDSNEDIIGQAAYTGRNAEATTTHSMLMGSIEISSSKTFEIRHQCSTTYASQGLGDASSFSVGEVYTQVKITKIK